MNLKTFINLAIPVLGIPLVTHCGLSKEDDNTQVVEEGIQISEIDARGMVFTSRSEDLTQELTKVRFLDFSSGRVFTILSDGDANPVVFPWGDDAVIHVSRARSKSIRTVLTYDGETFLAGDGEAVQGWEPGEPAGIVQSSDNIGFFVGAGRVGTVNIEVATTGNITDIEGLRATVVRQIGDYVAVGHTAADDSGHVSGQSAVFLFKREAEADEDRGGYSGLDADPETEAIDGLAVGSDYIGDVVKSTSGFNALSICPDEIAGCKNRTHTLNETSLSIAAGGEFDFADRHFLGEASIIDNGSRAVVQYKEGGERKLGILNLSTETVADVYTYRSSNLGGFLYDEKSGFLITGDHDGVNGTVHVFDGNELFGEFEIDDHFYNGIFVN